MNCHRSTGWAIKFVIDLNYVSCLSPTSPVLGLLVWGEARLSSGYATISRGYLMQKIKLPDRRILVIIIVAVVAALALMGYLRRGSGKSAGFKTVQVKRGDIRPRSAPPARSSPRKSLTSAPRWPGRSSRSARTSRQEASTTARSRRRARSWPRLTIPSMPRTWPRPRRQLEQAQAGLLRAEADLRADAGQARPGRGRLGPGPELGPVQCAGPRPPTTLQGRLRDRQGERGVGEAAVAQAAHRQPRPRPAWTRAQRNLSYCTIKSRRSRA